MKSLQTLFIAAVAALAFSACSEKKPTNNIVAKKPVVKAPSGPVKMQDSKFADEVQWNGKSCNVNIVRRADTSLPVITDDAGGKYYDNVIDIKIEANGGNDGTQGAELLFHKTFGKQDFASMVDAEYLKKSALLGIVFDRVEGDKIIFAASVGQPDVLSDDFVPMLVTVSRSGGMTISKDTRLDSDVEEETAER